MELTTKLRQQALLQMPVAPVHRNRRMLLKRLGTMLVAGAAAEFQSSATAIWIQSSALEITVDADGNGVGVVLMASERVEFAAAGLYPGFDLSERETYLLTGEAYFLQSAAALIGPFVRIEQNIDMVSVNGVRGGEKFQNANGVVIYLVGTSNTECLHPDIQSMTIGPPAAIDR